MIVFFRIFDICEEETPIQTIRLSASSISDDSLYESKLSPFAQSLGENAVSFDFGPPIAKCYDADPTTITSHDECLWPIYVLRGNGDVLLCYSSLENPYVSECICGPLTMLPAAEDNYGVDACHIIALDCVPPLIVIATSSGILYHCIALESSADETNDSNQHRSLLPRPTLYVYESVELALSLTISTASDDQDENSCPIRLHKDPITPLRYYCSHQNGAYAVAVPFVSQLKSAKDEVHFKEDESVVEHLICTKSVGSSTSDAPLILLFPTVKHGQTTLIAMLKTGELVKLRLTPTYLEDIAELCSKDSHGQTSNVALPRIDFAEHIKQILKRARTVPLLKSSVEKGAEPNAEQLLQLLLTVTETLRREYIQKMELAAVAIEKRVAALKQNKEVQLKELYNCQTEADSLLTSLESFKRKYESALTKQDSLSLRVDRVLESLHHQQPELSDAEKKLLDTLKDMSDAIMAHRNRFEQIQLKIQYQKDQMAKLTTMPLRLQQQITPLPSPNQIKSIKEMLTNE